MLLVWLSLAFMILAFAGGIAFAVKRTISFFRDLGRLGDSIGRALEDVADRAAKLGERDPSRGDALARSLARLGVDRARLGVLLDGIAEVREAGRAVTAQVPRK